MRVFCFVLFCFESPSVNCSVLDYSLLGKTPVLFGHVGVRAWGECLAERDDLGFVQLGSVRKKLRASYL